MIVRFGDRAAISSTPATCARPGLLLHGAIGQTCSLRDLFACHSPTGQSAHRNIRFLSGTDARRRTNMGSAFAQRVSSCQVPQHQSRSRSSRHPAVHYLPHDLDCLRIAMMEWSHQGHSGSPIARLPSLSTEFRGQNDAGWSIPSGCKCARTDSQPTS
jgi:hypothetical protein